MIELDSDNMKKIVIAIPYYSHSGGLSQYVRNLCSVLNEQNRYEIVVLSTHDSDCIDLKTIEGAFRQIGQSITFKSIRSRNPIVRYFSTFKFLKSFRPDIIINNYNGLVQRLLSFLDKNIKVMHVVHGDWPDFFRIASINGLRNNCVVVPSNAVKKHFNSYTSEKYKGKVITIPHGVQQGLKRRDSAYVRQSVLFVGVLDKHKGVHYLPEIIQRIKKSVDDATFTIVGDGPLKAWLEEELKIEITSGVVRITGPISHKEVYEEMSQSDVFLYPTRTDSFGLVIAEAMMNGAVPVATLLPDVTDEIVEDSINGFLIPENNIEFYADRAIEILHDKEKLKMMRLNAIEKANVKFSEARMCESYIRILGSM